MSIRLLSFCTAFLLLCLVHLSASISVANIPEERISASFYTKKSLQNGAPIFSNEKISISGFYPNPVGAVATMEYEISGNLKEAKITLTNVLGNVVTEQKLIREMRKIQFTTTDYPPGIYFYTLSVDGKSVFTRKLVIRHV